MSAEPQSKPSFTPRRKWTIMFHVCFLTLIVLSVVVMANYLSRDYFLHLHCSTQTQIQLSPMTVKVLQSITNRVRVTIYYDKNEPLYSTVAELLNEYKLVNPRISVQTIDYLRDPGTAQQVKTDYRLGSANDKNLVIFNCEGRGTKVVDGAGLAKYVLEEDSNAKDRQFIRKQTTFEGEKIFTAVLLAVTNPKPLKAYFLTGHEEHQADSGDEATGYLKFNSALKQNYIQVEPLSFVGTNAVPADCHLLVIAGPRTPLEELELEKIEQYLNQGGRLLVLFNCLSLNQGETGLEQLLRKWGVDVGRNVIKDPDNSFFGTDVVVSDFSKHQLVNPLLQSRSRLHLILPRSVGQLKPRTKAADASRVEEIAFSGPKAQAFFGNNPVGGGQRFPLMAAVEKGAIKGVITERGTTRIVVVGDSIFLANHQIDSAANRDFAGYAVNWLLDRTQLLQGLGPRPVLEYKIIMTRTQLRQTEWILLGGMPGAVLLLGGLVWLRRRS